jgi:hypothetical protein
LAEPTLHRMNDLAARNSSGFSGPGSNEVSELGKLEPDGTAPFVFVSERGGPLSPDMIARIVERAGEAANLGFHVHP